MLPFTLQQLYIFKAVAREKNFTKAAKVLYLSQPYISKQVKILENNLHAILFNRDYTKLLLTENGQLFLKYSYRILELCEESCRSIVDLKNSHRGTLKVGTSQTIASYLIPQILGLFVQRYPQINLNVKTNSTRLILKQIINQQIDIAIIDGKISKTLKTKLISNFFVDDDLNLIISKSHPLVQRSFIKKKDLYNLSFITLHPNSINKNFVDNILKQNMIEVNKLKVRIQLNSFESIKTAVSLDLGVAFISSLAIKKEIKLQSIKIIPIENTNITRTISVINNGKCYKSKAFNLFYNQVLSLKKT